MIGINNNLLKWKKLKEKHFTDTEKFLRENEEYYTGACCRFIEYEKSNTHIWGLCGKKNEIHAIFIYSKGIFFPVLPFIKKIPSMDFLKSFLRLKRKIHSVHGLKNEVIFVEDELEKAGRQTAEIFDYDFMCLDKLQNILKGPEDLVLRYAKLTDIENLMPLQEAYEKEEVKINNSAFNAAACRMKLTKLINNDFVLAAEKDGQLTGKININAVSFTRCQIGGVFVHPDFRGLGIAQRMTSEFTEHLINSGRKVSLFVKKSNLIAQKLYKNLGFYKIADFRISYY